MGNVASRPDEGAALYLKDQSRLSIASLVVSNSRRKTLLNVVPNAFPATRLTAKREQGDDAPIEFIQDPETASNASPPNFILRFTNEEELMFKFTFIIRQTPVSAIASASSPTSPNSETLIQGLTFAFASTNRDLDNLVTREFRADPNIHKNSNVQFIGDFSTEGSQAIQFEWTWTWRPPKTVEDKGGGWRNICSFLDYDQKAHKLNTLATFVFWVTNVQRLQGTPMASPGFELSVPPRLRVPSTQSYQSRTSDSEATTDIPEPSSPVEPSSELPLTNQQAEPIKVDVSCGRPGEDMSVVDDGPVFRATMKALEQRTGSMRSKIKKVLKKAEAAQQAQVDCNIAIKAFLFSLQEASTTNATAIKPALDHYFNQIAQQILLYEMQNSANLQRLIIEPVSKLYNLDIKQAEAKKKDFEEESRDYYAYLGRYLGQRQDSLKDKKRAESDSKYQNKRRTFELARFDYSSFMQDLHGGRKEQELLSQLTKYAESQAQSFLTTSKKIEELRPQLEALVREVNQADKEFNFQRTEREEKRRALEKSSIQYNEPENIPNPSITSATAATSIGVVSNTSDSEMARADSSASHATWTSNGSSLHPSLSNASSTSTLMGTSPVSAGPGSTISPAQNRFKGIRDLEERDSKGVSSDRLLAAQRKEGLLWALSRPGSHMDPKGINKQAWHKFWIVLDQGKLSEYSNWKQRLDLHMEPIDLRMASVRMARDAERRFCFEVITPQFKRIYQATSEDDMSNWITAINNALQSAMEGRLAQPPQTLFTSKPDPNVRDIGSVLTGKSTSLSGHHSASYRPDTSGMSRRTTVGARPVFVRTESNSFEENPSKLLDVVRDADQGNCWCADCGSGAKVEWVSINLGIVLCIECSGIHRSLGTHISKIRSLTLDVNSFTNDIVELLLLIGNRVSNMVWESKLDPALKPISSSTREQRLRFITAKYAQRAYVSSIATSSAFASPDETLVTSVKKNDVQGVLHGIALRANVNAHDRSRGTHVVFLALAAADPATPGSTVPSPAASPRLKATPVPPKHVAFPMAELLVQNGADIPSQMPAIPLSPAAQLYIEQRTGRGTSTGTSGGSSGNDRLSALPTIRGVSGSGSTSSGVSENQSKEAKLQKRGSAGSRFAGKVASLGAS